MAEPKRLRARLRGILRAVHRDAGYLCVGLTFVYAASGIAVNHVKDWDPNFRHVDRTVTVPGPFSPDDDLAARQVATKLGIVETPKEVFRAAEDELEVVFERRTLHVDTRTGKVDDEAQEPRFFLRAANFLHLNRGKKAWSYVADTYAAGLLLLATSGLFMIPGSKGLVGRGALLAGLGAAIPIAYVVLSRGP
jgi:hypothetical protein